MSCYVLFCTEYLGGYFVNYERIILELLSRINALEERVALLEGIEEPTKQIETKEIPVSSKKYRLLSDYLYNSEESRIQLSFRDIEEKLGFDLPKSAHDHRAFWANTTSHSIALSWIGVGYETVEVDMDGKFVVFEKKRQYKA